MSTTHTCMRTEGMHTNHETYVYADVCVYGFTYSHTIDTYTTTAHQGPWMRSTLTGQDVTPAFSRFYGSMDIIPFIGDNFNRAVPIFIALLAVFQVRFVDGCVCVCVSSYLRLLRPHTHLRYHTSGPIMNGPTHTHTKHNLLFHHHDDHTYTYHRGSTSSTACCAPSSSSRCSSGTRPSPTTTWRRHVFTAATIYVMCLCE